MEKNYSLEFRASYQIALILTNSINGFVLAKPVLLEIDPDCILNTEPITVKGQFDDREAGFVAALERFDVVEMAILAQSQKSEPDSLTKQALDAYWDLPHPEAGHDLDFWQ